MKQHTPARERQLSFVPKYYVPEILTAHYDTLLEKIKIAFYWDAMNRDIKEYVKNCPTCQKIKVHNQKWIGLNAKGPLPTSAHGKKYMLVMTEFATQYAVAHKETPNYVDNPACNGLTEQVNKLLAQHLTPCASDDPKYSDETVILHDVPGGLWALLQVLSLAKVASTEPLYRTHHGVYFSQLTPQIHCEETVPLLFMLLLQEPRTPDNVDKWFHSACAIFIAIDMLTQVTRAVADERSQLQGMYLISKYITETNE
ncbi:hypothetical protein PR048_011344, partial [Dryococelus australis]